MDVGAELARARQRLGLSLEQVAEATKIGAPRLDALERNEVEKLPSVLYIRGFLRAYALEVGLDPDDITYRYLAQFDQLSGLTTEAFATERNALAELFESEATALTDHFDSEVQATQLQQPVSAQHPAFGLELFPLAASSPKPLRIDAAQPAHEDAFRSTAPVATHRPWRSLRRPALIALLAGIGLAGWLTFLNVAGSPTAGTSPSPVNVAEPGIAAARGTSPSVAADVQGAHSEPGAAAPAPAASGERPAGRRAGTTQPEPARMNTAPHHREPENGTAGMTGDLTGSWTLTNFVESTSYKGFEGLRLGYRLQLEQDGTQVTGRGRKWSENGEALAASRRTPITVAGTLAGRQLQLKFSERGARRPTGGTFELQLAADGSLHGTFSSDAARSQGSSHAQRTQ